MSDAGANPCESLLEPLLRTPLTLVEACGYRLSAGETGRGLPVPDQPRVIYVERGGLRYEVDDARIDLPTGSLFYFPGWLPRRLRDVSATGSSFMVCKFVAPGPSDTPACGVVWREAERAVELSAMRRVLKWMQSQRPARFAAAEAELKAMIARLFLHGESVSLRLSPSPPATAESDRPHISPTMREAIDWLHTHFREPDAIAMLYERVALSVDHFRRSFKAETGRSPRDHLLVLRMRYARYRLRNTDESVQQVALACGYVDPYTFSKRYKQFYGLPPSEEPRR